MLALLGCTDERLAALDGAWAVDPAALAADPRLAGLGPAVRQQAVQAANAAIGAPLVLRGGVRWADGAPAGRLVLGEGEGLAVVGPDGALVQIERLDGERMVWVHGRKRLPLRRVEAAR